VPIPEVIERVHARFGEAVQEVIEFRGETTLVVRREALVEICRFLRDDPACRFNFLSDLCAVDYWPERPRFAVNYHLYSLPHNLRLRVKVFLEEEDPVVPTVTGIWPTANWHEREVYDLFGIRFEGHPDLRRILLPEDWEGHPLRRDHPLVVEPVQFSFNWREIDARKPYARE